MKVLWIVNLMLPELAVHLNKNTETSGTWLVSLSKEISNHPDVELAVACVSGDEFVDVTVGNIRYFCIPGNGKTMLFYKPGLVKYWDMIEERFPADIVHFHGTEYTHGISYLRKYKDKKKLLTIQGIRGKTSQCHTGGMSFKTTLFNRTISECLKFNGMIEKRILSGKNVKYENEIIKSVSYATGRTDWDKFYMEALNPNIKYFRCNYNLREEFYLAEKWSLEKCKKNYIYASTSAQVPMKGGHIVLRAIDLVRRKYPDIKFVFLANKVENGMIVPTSGYTSYIRKLIKKLGIESNVEFLTRQNAEGIISLMQKSHVVIVPSAIENASSVLREAMHLGAPCVASFRGGITHLIDDGKSGFLYDYPEYEYLAGRIVEILENDPLAKSLSENAIASAEAWHNKEKNLSDMVDIYKTIMEN